MIHALNLDKDNRVLSTTWDEYAPPKYPRVKDKDMPKKEDGTKDDVRNYLYIDGKFVYEPLPEDSEIESESTTDEVLNVLLGIGGEA